MTSFSRQVPFPEAKWILPRPSIHSQTCHFENLSKVTLLWRLKPLFHWAENCYWIWSWIIGSHVPNATCRKGGVMFYCHAQTNDILKLSSTNGLGIVGRDIALLCIWAISSEELPGNLERMQFTLIRENGMNGINKKYIWILKGNVQPRAYIYCVCQHRHLQIHFPKSVCYEKFP